jgi:CheY-like chemotaxis protein
MPYKLLLADDSVTIQRVIELTFADEDVKVIAVGDGQTAIDRITADPPDIVLADVGMPARDGYEVAAFVKNTPDLAHIPVLLLTGAFEPVDEARASAVRCDGVLAKPFEPQLLIGRVKELLGGGDVDPDATIVLRAPVAVPPPDDDDTGPIPAATSAGGFTAEDFSLDTGGVGDASSAMPNANVSLDDYFDRLDAAFATLSGAPAGQLKDATAGRDDTSWAPPSAGAWSPADPTGMSAAARIPDPPSGGVTAAREPRVEFPPAAPVVAPAPTPSPASVSTPAPVPVADAFAALLEAEQQGGVPAAAPAVAGEVTVGAVAFGTPAITDALIDDIAQRVALRLAGAALPDAVARIVSEAAERLVREEIERLKAAASGQ